MCVVEGITNGDVQSVIQRNGQPSLDSASNTAAVASNRYYTLFNFVHLYNNNCVKYRVKMETVLRRIFESL